MDIKRHLYVTMVRDIIQATSVYLSADCGYSKPSAPYTRVALISFIKWVLSTYNIISFTDNVDELREFCSANNLLDWNKVFTPLYDAVLSDFLHTMSDDSEPAVLAYLQLQIGLVFDKQDYVPHWFGTGYWSNGNFIFMHYDIELRR